MGAYWKANAKEATLQEATSLQKAEHEWRPKISSVNVKAWIDIPKTQYVVVSHMLDIKPIQELFPTQVHATGCLRRSELQDD